VTDLRRRLRRVLATVPALEALARLTVETIRVCLRYRVTGLASEAGFFALLSLPPLVLGLFGGVGYVGRWLGPETVDDVRGAIETYAARFLTEDVISSTLGPTVDSVFLDGRFDLISVGFVLSLWSGSRALNVFVDTIAIMYGQSGVRGIVQTRVLSFSLYVIALLVGIVTIPLVLIGPTLLGRIVPQSWEWLTALYWPLVTLLTVGGLTSLYHVATPRRSPWLRDAPGAVLTLAIWIIASFVVRGSIAASLGGASIYGPLSAPIVLLIWLYALAIAVLIGAALNAAVRTLWPHEERRGLRRRALDWTRGAGSATAERLRAVRPRRRAGATEDDLGLAGVREAARQPLTPVGEPLGGRRPGSGDGRPAAATKAPGADRQGAVEERTGTGGAARHTGS
jgi:membrane protein